jgi:glycine cleavage system H protein
MNVKKDLLYTRDHEWVKQEGEFTFVGITDYAQDSMGDIVFVEMPGIGDSFSEGDSMAVVESVKAVSDVYSPGSGTVDSVNELLEDSPELLNKDCYGQYIVKFMDFSAEGLLSPEEYEELISKES